MEWCEQEDAGAPLRGAGQQEIKACIYLPLVVIHSMGLEATTLQCEQAGTEVMGMAREEGDRRYVDLLIISPYGASTLSS